MRSTAFGQKSTTQILHCERVQRHIIDSAELQGGEYGYFDVLGVPYTIGGARNEWF
jgi:hypothetical protein